MTFYSVFVIIYDNFESNISRNDHFTKAVGLSEGDIVMGETKQ